jgi:hypothetical protein
MSIAEYMMRREAPPATVAWNTGHCADQMGRPFFDAERHLCVDAAGHSGYSPRPAEGVYADEGTTCLSQWPQTKDAGKLCTKYNAYGVWLSPVLNPKVKGTDGKGCNALCGQPGYEVCDGAFGTCVKGHEEKADEEPWMDWWTERGGGMPPEAHRASPYIAPAEGDPRRGEMSFTAPEYKAYKRTRVRATRGGKGSRFLGLSGCEWLTVVGVFAGLAILAYFLSRPSLPF